MKSVDKKLISFLFLPVSKPHFLILSLQNLKPFFLSLCPCDLVSSPILDILPPVRIRRQRVSLIFKN